MRRAPSCQQPRAAGWARWLSTQGSPGASREASSGPSPAVVRSPSEVSSRCASPCTRAAAARPQKRDARRPKPFQLLRTRAVSETMPALRCSPARSGLPAPTSLRQKQEPRNLCRTRSCRSQLRVEVTRQRSFKRLLAGESAAHRGSLCRAARASLGSHLAPGSSKPPSVPSAPGPGSASTPRDEGALQQQALPELARPGTGKRSKRADTGSHLSTHCRFLCDRSVRAPALQIFKSSVAFCLHGSAQLLPAHKQVCPPICSSASLVGILESAARAHRLLSHRSGGL